MDTFENRVSICASYRGLRDDPLNAASGLKDCSFVHATGFIGGAWSQDSAIKIAEASLKEIGIDLQKKPTILGKREKKEEDKIEEEPKSNEPKQIYYFKDGLRFVSEYNHEFTCHAKRRWIG